MCIMKNLKPIKLRSKSKHVDMCTPFMVAPSYKMKDPSIDGSFCGDKNESKIYIV